MLRPEAQRTQRLPVHLWIWDDRTSKCGLTSDLYQSRRDPQTECLHGSRYDNLQPGDIVNANYFESGYFYESTVVSVDHASGTAVVEFDASWS